LKKVLLASVLKPCDDTRIYEKFAVSLSKNYLVEILARASHHPSRTNITYKDILKGDASPFKRIIAWLQCLFYLFKNRPDIVIVHSPELLPVLFVYTLFSKAKTVYDVRENYYFNIKYQQNYKGIKKAILAKTLSYLERLSTSIIDGYILAEKTYDKELSFHKKNYCILENKFAGSFNEIGINLKNKKKCFVFTGTISVEYGIWEALHFVEKLHKIDNEVRLVIVGHVVNKSLKEELHQFLDSKPYIELKEGNPLVPHQQIIDLFSRADFALLPYQPNLSTANCIPTKLYEALALKIPMLIQNNALWEEICVPYQAGIFIDFKNFNPEKIYQQLNESHFYKKNPGKEVLWETEEKKLMKFVSEL